MAELDKASLVRRIPAKTLAWGHAHVFRSYFPPSQFTYSWVADQLGLTKVHVHRYSTGKRCPNLQMMYLIAHYLDKTLDEYFEEVLEYVWKYGVTKTKTQDSR